MKTQLLLSMLVIAFLSSCTGMMQDTVKGNGNITTTTRSIEANKIACYGAYNVELTQGSPGSVKIESDENLLEYITTDEEDGVLKIKTKRDVNLSPTKKITLYITTNRLESFELAGAGNVKSTNKFSGGDHLDLSLSGTGDITIDVNTPEVKSKIAGTGNIHISGETQIAETTIAGAGDYDAENLKTEDTKITIAGSGNAKLFADKTLNVTIAGVGDVSYKGNASLTQKIAGSGKIKKLD